MRRAQGGFTYIGLLLAVAVLSGALAATAQVWHTLQRRERERELLFIGDQFRRALTAYAKDGNTPQTRFPRALEDLVKDPRVLHTRRYLRRIYTDPITLEAKWGLVRQTDGGIIGIYSLSEAAPLKTANFGLKEQDFENKKKYSEWVFRPKLQGGAPIQPGVPGAATQPQLGAAPGAAPGAASAVTESAGLAPPGGNPAPFAPGRAR